MYRDRVTRKTLWKITTPRRTSPSFAFASFFTFLRTLNPVVRSTVGDATANQCFVTGLIGCTSQLMNCAGPGRGEERARTDVSGGDG
jgi:hypothetical protein